MVDSVKKNTCKLRVFHWESSSDSWPPSDLQIFQPCCMFSVVLILRYTHIPEQSAVVPHSTREEVYDTRFLQLLGYAGHKPFYQSIFLSFYTQIYTQIYTASQQNHQCQLLTFRYSSRAKAYILLRPACLAISDRFNTTGSHTMYREKKSSPSIAITFGKIHPTTFTHYFFPPFENWNI